MALLAATLRVLLLALGRALGVLVLLLLAVWTAGALWLSSVPWPAVRAVLTLAFVAGLGALLVLGRPLAAVGFLAIVFLATALRLAVLVPRRDADWVPNEARTPWAEIDGDRITVHDVRNTAYRTNADYDPRWETRTYDLAALRRAWFAMVPFRDVRLGAHAFVSFEFEGDRFLAISIEARKEKGEEYGILAGLFRRFELIYVIADERDVVGLRSHVRGDDVYLYPVRADPDALRAFFLDMLATANALRERPRFYNSLGNTCLTGLARHLGDVGGKDLRWRIGVLFPALSDRLALREGLLDTDLAFEEARRRYRVDASRTTRDDPAFSRRIRGRP